MPNKPITILDVDLDYFVHPRLCNPIAQAIVQNNIRAAEDSLKEDTAGYSVDYRKFHVWRTPASTIDNLSKFGLVTEGAPLYIFPSHDGAYTALRYLIAKGKIQPQFNIVRLDAHSDLYGADSGYVDIRRIPDLISQQEIIDSNLNEANYLNYLYALDWLQQVYWVRPLPSYKDPDPISQPYKRLYQVTEHQIRHNLAPASIVLLSISRQWCAIPDVQIDTMVDYFKLCFKHINIKF